MNARGARAREAREIYRESQKRDDLGHVYIDSFPLAQQLSFGTPAAAVALSLSLSRDGVARGELPVPSVASLSPPFLFSCKLQVLHYT